MPMSSSGMPVVLRIALISVVLVAGIYDLRFRRIPNWLNLSGVILGVGINTLLFEQHGLAASTLGLLCALGIYVPLYLIRGMGAGDVKLMAAVGAIAGPENWLWIFLATALLGGFVSLVFVAIKGRFHQTILNLILIVAELSHFRLPSEKDSRLDVRNKEALRIPHGALIATGSMAFLLFNAVA
ncbi:MAG: prepilin peptidase [Acidobacteriaceae bacterium]|nr:prepilin peptidase [Acidobacteriaceae bacterium]MBV9296051.1 prepilin peptidase [Acidobacteriaceae bacterium]MBV9764442.1 prepilin peptidase [Acidobacteriaceae bacterium]